MANLWSRRISFLFHMRSPDTWSPNLFLAFTLIVPSFTSYSPVTLNFFVIHTQPPAHMLLSPPGLCVLLSPWRVPFPPSRADPFSTLPQQCFPPTHQASIVIPRLCCFCLFMSLFCQLDHEFFGTWAVSYLPLNPHSPHTWHRASREWLLMTPSEKVSLFSPFLFHPVCKLVPFCSLGLYKNVLLLGSLSIQHSICEQREASQRGAKKALTSQPFQEGMLYVNTRWTCVQIHNSFLNSISELSRFSSKLYLLLISLDIVCKAVLNY